MEKPRLRLLGKPELVDSEGREVEGLKGVSLGLLAYLLLQDRPVGRDQLAGLFWPGAGSRHSRHSLRQLLHRLRAGLPEGIIRGSENLSASPDALSIDLFDFSALIRDHRPEEALDLWRGPFLSGFRRPESWEL